MLNIDASNGTVAIKLRKIIKEKGLKQTYIAERTGFTAQEFSDMLNGRRLMRAVDISAIVNVLGDVGVEANDLFSPS